MIRDLPGRPSLVSEYLHFLPGVRIPVVQQSEASECGLACLAMIAGAHGLELELRELRRRFPVSVRGATLEQLITIASALELIGRPLRLDLEELVNLDRPCLLHWEMNHFVVLVGTTKKGVVIHDPSSGRRVVPWADVSKSFTGIACEFSRTSSFKKKIREPRITLRTLIGTVRGLGRSLVQIFALALVLEIFTLLSPQFIQITVDQVLADGDADLLKVLGLGFLGILALQTIVTAMRSWTVTFLGTRFNFGWTANVFSHLLSLPQEYFLKRHLGDVISRFSAITSIQQTLTTQFVSAILDGLMAMLTLAVLFMYSQLLAFAVLGTMTLYVVLRLLHFQEFRAANLGQVVAAARQQSCFVESVRGIQTIRLSNQGPRQVTRYLNATASLLNKGVQVQRLNLRYEAMNGLVNGGQRIVVLWLGARFALDGQLSAGMLMAFASYADQFVTRGANLVDYLIQVRLLRIQGDRLADIMLADPEVDSRSQYVGPMPEPSVRFENVSFRYGDGEPWIIRNASFDIFDGEAVAIVGPSGAGKTTLVRLLLGLVEPVEGRILVGGIDLAHLGKTKFRDMLGTVLQDDTLFAGSIADNISLFAETADMSDIERAARLAQLHDDIVAMPMGYHSLVGDMGSALSGGQQQRLFLARALFRRPKILVLDEATSHLDSEREGAINTLIGNMGLTRILVAHRRETRGLASREILVSGGVVSSFDRGMIDRAASA